MEPCGSGELLVLLRDKDDADRKFWGSLLLLRFVSNRVQKWCQWVLDSKEPRGSACADATFPESFLLRPGRHRQPLGRWMQLMESPGPPSPRQWPLCSLLLYQLSLPGPQVQCALSPFITAAFNAKCAQVARATLLRGGGGRIPACMRVSPPEGRRVNAAIDADPISKY